METCIQSDKIKIVVLDENVLGYIFPELPNFVSVLKSSILKGSSFPDFANIPIGKGSHFVRLATENDFEEFKVCNGYKNDRYHN